MYVIERLIDLAARRHGFDRIALRRRNLVKSSAMPYRNPVGLVYDSGDYAAALDRLVELSDWKGFESRRADARRRGRYRGIGFAHYIELNTGDPRERAEITVRPEGRIDVVLGTLSAGQGHETSFPQLIAEWFGVEHGTVKLITGDTDLMPIGGGTASGRSMRLGAVVMAKASDQIVERGRRIAASLLEAAEPDIEFARRRFTVKGTDRSVDLFAVAAAAVRAGEPLAGACTEVMPVPSFPYGCAVCEVEVDPDTGGVEVVRHTTVDDVGRAVNPMILHGQAHGGIAAGIGQALWELCAYDEATGQLTAATLMDYALPRADALPSFVTELSEVPSTSNPLGLRGGGEGGTTPALGAVVNAVVDALAEFGVEHLDMPVTRQRRWRVPSPAPAKTPGFSSSPITACRSSWSTAPSPLRKNSSRAPKGTSSRSRSASTTSATCRSAGRSCAIRRSTGTPSRISARASTSPATAPPTTPTSSTTSRWSG
jgi:carbon-monoxide dehydrogenase large subunit